MQLTDRELRERTVIGSDGRTIGEVAGMVLDPETWRVQALSLKLRKDVAGQIGISRSGFRMPLLDVPVSLVQSVGDAVILSVKAEQLHRGGEEAQAPLQ